MINITLPDGNKKNFLHPISGYEIASSVSKSLAKEALLIEVDGVLHDLSFIITKDAKVRVLVAKDDEVLSVIRHDAAHIMAQAVKELFPSVQVTIGPAIENGFYYDFATSTPFSTDDLAIIEAKMYEIVKRDLLIIREVWNRDDAIKFFTDLGEIYKAEIIADIDHSQEITLYRQGNFVDLCRGPHLPSTGKVKHFKLMKLAGAYWRGDSNNQMLQRIYGTAWATQGQLEEYLKMLEEAERRDHRKLGKELKLFHFQEEAQGVPFWHDKGWTIYLLIEQYIRKKLTTAEYIEVRTPLLLNRKLWELSGHLEKFGENMFLLEHDNKGLALKPMNCPCHVQIFKQETKSYRDLPLRMAEFGLCHRNEPSGGLHGLMRVRAFAQDDAHIFCTEDQIIDETISFCELLKSIYKDFGFEAISVKFSDRPQLRAGSDQIWNKAEKALTDAVKATGLDYTLNPGEGAFYGPKLEFCLRDAIGRVWQCGTLQVDFILPERLDACYIDHVGNKQRPVMLHRAILGSLERFIGILLEEYCGNLPLWLAPLQVAVINVTNVVDEYAKEINSLLKARGIRTVLDISNEKVNYKIRHFSNQKVPLIVVLGEKEKQNNTIAVRKLGASGYQEMVLADLIETILQENTKYLD